MRKETLEKLKETLDQIYSKLKHMWLQVGSKKARDEAMENLVEHFIKEHYLLFELARVREIGTAEKPLNMELKKGEWRRNGSLVYTLIGKSNLGYTKIFYVEFHHEEYAKELLRVIENEGKRGENREKGHR